MLDILDEDLQPAMEGAQGLLVEAYPGLGIRAGLWVDRMVGLTERLLELKAAFQQLAEEAAEFAQEDEEDTIIGLG